MFAFCFENSDSYCGYITEKIFDAFFSGTIPIYFGAPDIQDYIPKNCYIDYRQFHSTDELVKKLKSIVEENYNIPIFITFNSRQLVFSNKFFTSNLDDCLEKIKNPFIVLNFYYINLRMARLLIRHLKTITRQIDIEIGLLANKINSSRNEFSIFKTNSIERNKNYISDIQFYILSSNELCELINLPEDICLKIYDFIPNVYKINRFRSSFNFYCGKNLLN